jgi:hypothetical protein
MKEDLKSFVSELDEEVRLLENEYDQRSEAFTRHIIDEIAKLIHIGDYEICHAVSYTSAKQVRGEIYGYSLSENKEVLTLFYTLYNQTAYQEIKSLNDSEFQTAINRMQGFYNLAIRSLSLDLEDNGDITNPLYAPAKLIRENYQEITTIHLVVLSNSLIKKYEIKNQRINGKLTTTDVWDLKKIYANFHSGLDHTPINIDFTSNDYKNFKIPFIEMESNDFGYKCVIALFPGKLLYKLYEIHNTNLLSNNVRYFLGFKGSQKNNANIGILRTLKEESQKFLAYNNGITALAEGIESNAIGEEIDITDKEGNSSNDLISMGILSAIRDFRIVNGGQTTAAIFTSKHNNPAISLYGVYVQVKIIVMPNNFETMASDITKYSNSQSKIKFSDFSVSNNFNITLEKLSRNTIIPNPNNDPIYWYFERLRGQFDQEKKSQKTKEDQKYFESKYSKERRFKKEEVAKIWKSWEGEPFDAVKGESTNYDLYMQKHEALTPDENYYRKTIALLIIYRFLTHRPENKMYGNRKATITAYAIAYLSYRTFGRLDLEKIWKQQALSENMIKYLNQLCEAINVAMQDLAGEIAVLSWGKRKQSFKDLVNYGLNDDSSLLDTEITEK